MSRPRPTNTPPTRFAPRSKPTGLMARVLLAATAAVLWPTLSVASASAVFPGANGKIALVTEYYASDGCGDCDPEGQRAWVMRRGGRPATFPATTVRFEPSGSRLAYERSGRIWIARPDGSHRRLLSGRGTAPAWSPAGRQIAYSGKPGLVVARANGAEKRPLPTAYAEEVTWSPDGSQLAFVSDSSVEVVDADGQDVRPVARGDYYSLFGLAWPSSRWLSYRREGGSLSIIRLGQNQARVFVRGLEPVNERPYSEYSWSPDGRRLAFVRDGDLWVKAVPAGGMRLIQRNAGYLVQWSPDGRQIAFVRAHGVFTVAAGGGQPRLFGRFDDPRTRNEYVADIDWQALPR